MDVSASLQGLGSFLAYFAAAIAALAVFVAVYMLITPHREVALIRAGNTAAAVSLSGAMLGFALPLASVIAHSVSLLDMALWSGVALIVQIALYLLVSAMMRGLSRDIENGNLAAGVTLAAASIVVGVLNAASMTY